MPDRLVPNDSRTFHGVGAAGLRTVARRSGLPCRAPDLLSVRCDEVWPVAGDTTPVQMRAIAAARNEHELAVHALTVDRLDEPRTQFGDQWAHAREYHRRGGRNRWRRGGGRP